MKTEAAKRKVVVPEPPRGAHYRLGRLPNHGLLVLYFLDPAGLDENNAIPQGFEDIEYIPTFAMSFPHSATAPGVDYIVKNDFWNEEDEEEEGI